MVFEQGVTGLICTTRHDNTLDVTIFPGTFSARLPAFPFRLSLPRRWPVRWFPRLPPRRAVNPVSLFTETRAVLVPRTARVPHRATSVAAPPDENYFYRSVPVQGRGGGGGRLGRWSAELRWAEVLTGAEGRPDVPTWFRPPGADLRGSCNRRDD